MTRKSAPSDSNEFKLEDPKIINLNTTLDEFEFDSDYETDNDPPIKSRLEIMLESDEDSEREEFIVGFLGNASNLVSPPELSTRSAGEDNNETKFSNQQYGAFFSDEKSLSPKQPPFVLSDPELKKGSFDFGFDENEEPAWIVNDRRNYILNEWDRLNNNASFEAKRPNYPNLYPGKRR